MAEGGRHHQDKTPTPPPCRNDNSSGEEDNGEDLGALDRLKKFFGKLHISSAAADDADAQKEKLTFETIAQEMKSGKYRNVIIMCGAGVSTSAGIPDFRSPGSGLYDNLQKYNLPDPQCIFEIEFFKANPKPFYALAKEILPSILKPTPCHYFMRLLHEKGFLLRLYTQNIDTLERIAGIPKEKIVEAHGTFHTSHCLRKSCHREFSLEWMKEKVFADQVPSCSACGSLVKPDIVFFGENLPRRFFVLSGEDFKKCDLLIVMGTSLVVQPFASLIDKVPKDTPRLLINKEKAGEVDPMMRFLGFGSGMDFDSKHNYRDVAWLGLCDDGCMALAKLLGWTEELRKLIKDEYQKIERQQQSDSNSQSQPGTPKTKPAK